MRISVLGKSPSWPDAGGACSGYLVQADAFTLLLDCGSGVFGQLRLAVPYRSVDAVLITHLHSDHFFDLVPFSYALTLGPGAGRRERPALHVPPGAREVLRAMLGAWGNPELIEQAFDLQEYAPGRELAPLRARLREVPHFTRTFAVELREGERRFTFGADCGPNQELVAFARGTDLLMLEATQSEPGASAERGHLTPAEAGAHARAAQAQRLVLTHFSDELDAERVGVQASEAFAAPVELARPGAVYEL